MTEYAYIARQPCGAITGAVVDDSHRELWTRSYTVERMELEQTSKQIGVCPKDPGRRWKQRCLYGCPLEKLK